MNDWDRTSELAGAGLLDWNNIQEMAENGIRFGSHTCTHPNLTRLSIAQAREEIRAARRIIEEQLQAPVRTFAYPYGQFNDTIKQLVSESGYDLACTYHPDYVGGSGHERFELRRTGVLATDTLEDFGGKVQANLKWRGQWYWRSLRNLFRK